MRACHVAEAAALAVRKSRSRLKGRYNEGSCGCELCTEAVEPAKGIFARCSRTLQLTGELILSPQAGILPVSPTALHLCPDPSGQALDGWFTTWEEGIAHDLRGLPPGDIVARRKYGRLSGGAQGSPGPPRAYPLITPLATSLSTNS